jgi:hypothetical protein
LRSVLGRQDPRLPVSVATSGHPNHLSSHVDDVRQSLVDPSGQGIEVLVSVEAGQRLRLLIFANLMIDLFEVTGDKRPRVDQIRCAECRECA